VAKEARPGRGRPRPRATGGAASGGQGRGSDGGGRLGRPDFGNFGGEWGFPFSHSSNSINFYFYP